MAMESTQICEECGGVLPPRAPLGLCPRCLFAAGLERRSDPLIDTEFTFSRDHPRRFGDYELLEEIARGGMGIVYRARQLTLDRIVAVKVLLFGKFSSDEFIERFRAEARVAAALQHPNIVSIHEVGEQEGQHYFSMDYIEGRDLADVIRDGPLPPRRAAVYLQTICGATQFSHDQGILHRDLKPSNILIDRFDQPRITDFGLAQPVAIAEAPAELRMAGSPGYVAPEQTDSQAGPITIAADIYSLGAILYHLLTGRVPFAAGTVEETLYQVRYAEPAPPHLMNPGVPRDLETICLKCLHKKPAHRYPTAAALAEDLGRWLRGEPIAARPAGRLEKFWSWCRREPAVAGLSALAASLLIMASILVTWQWRRAETNANLYRSISYADGMKAAFAEFQEGNLGQVNRLLEEQKPRPGERDLRAFEWHYLYQLTHPKQFLMLPRLKQVAGSLAFSPKSRFLATYNWDDTLRLWDVQQAAKPLLTVTNTSGIGAFTPQGDQYIGGDRNGSVHTYSLPSGEIVRSSRLNGELVAISGDVSRFVTIQADGTLQALEANSGKTIFTAPVKVPRRSYFGWNALVAISTDGNLLAYVLPSRTHEGLDRILVFDLATGLEVCQLQHPQVRCLVFSPSSTQLAIAGGQGSALLWSHCTGRSKLLQGRNLPLFALSFSADGTVLAVGGTDETIQLWNVSTGTARPGLLRPHLGDVMSLAFSPNGKWLASGGRDTEVRLMPVDETPAAFIQHNVNSDEWGNFAFSADSTLMAAALRGDLIKVWKVNSLTEVASLPGARYLVGFAADNEQLLVASSTADPVWWNLRTGTRKSIPAYSGSPLSAACLSADQKLAVLGHDNGEIELLDVNSGSRIARWQGHPDKVLSLAFSPRADQFVSGSSDRAVALWNVADQKEIAFNVEHRGAICALAFSGTGNLIASACGADTIKFWRPSSLQRGSLAPSMSFHKAQILSLDFSPDAKTLASGSEDETLRLWNVGTHQEMASLPMGSPVQLVRFSPNGKNLAVVTKRGELRLLSAP